MPLAVLQLPLGFLQSTLQHLVLLFLQLLQILLAFRFLIKDHLDLAGFGIFFSPNSLLVAEAERIEDLQLLQLVYLLVQLSYQFLLCLDLLNELR